MRLPTLLTFCALFLLAQIPALRPLTKFMPEFSAAPTASIATLLIVAAVALWVVLHPSKPMLKALQTPWPSAMLVVALSLVALYVYPLADGLKAHNLGSDADDAMILAGTALTHLQNPYALTTYFGNPFSPGPGWVALWSPLSRLGLYPLITTLSLAATLFTFRRTGHSWLQTNQWAIALFTSLLVWELAAVGNDLPALGLLILSASLLILQKTPTKTETMALILLLGALATSRIMFTYLPILMGFALWAQGLRQQPAGANPFKLSPLPAAALWQRRSIATAVGGLSLAAILHLYFMQLNPQGYPPLHLLTKSQTLLPPALLDAALALCAATAVAMLKHWRTWHPTTHMAIGLLAPLSALALADLFHNSGHLPLWEGASYLIPALPLTAYTILRKTNP